jgi:hypothetical protein
MMDWLREIIFHVIFQIQCGFPASCKVIFLCIA